MEIKDEKILLDNEVVNETKLMETFTAITQSIENATISTAVSTDNETAQTEKPNSDNAILTQKENSEKSILYQNALSDNIDLEYVPTLNGIKENIIIREYENVNEFKFVINTNGLSPQCLEGDSIPLLDPKTGEMIMYIGQIDARDSYVGNNENDDKHFSLFNSLSLEPTDKNSEYILTVTVDKEFLESETTVYPVTIDPSISIPNYDTEDAPVYSGYPNSNFYTNAYNIVGYHNSAYGEAATYVQTKSIDNFKFINPKNITSAYYHAYEGSGKTSGATVEVRDTATSWNSPTITYSNQPADFRTVSSLYINSSGWKNFDITDLTKNWLSFALKEPGYNQIYGFSLKMNTTGVSSRHFCSANNSSYPPSVIINYNDGPTISDGVYNIRSKYSDLYLDTEQNPDAAENVIQYGFHGDLNQQWKVVYQGDGYYKLYSPWYNNTKCLDVQNGPTNNGANVDVFNDGPGDWILFKIVSNNDGTYRIMSKWSGNQKVLDVTGPSRQPGTNIQLWDYVGEIQQKWYFERVTGKTTYVNNNATTQNYNSSGSASYANKYANYVSPDPEYDTPEYRVTDNNKNCANFVSQCLRAGGLEDKGSIINNRKDESFWFYNLLLGKATYAGSYSWGSASYFARHWGHDETGAGLQRSYKTIVYSTLKDAFNDWNYIASLARIGDVLQLTGSTGQAFHTMIVTSEAYPIGYIDNEISYSQHTDNANGRPLYVYLSNNINSDQGLLLHMISRR